MVTAGRAVLERVESWRREGAGAWAVEDDDIGAAASLIDEVRVGLDALLVDLVREGIRRGLPKAGGYSAADWLGLHTPGLPWADRYAVTTVAMALEHPDPAIRAAHVEVAERIASGVLRVQQARRVLKAMERVRPHVSGEAYAAGLATLLAAAESGREKDLAKAADGVIAQALPEDPKDAEAQRYAARAARLRTIRSRRHDQELTELTLTLDGPGAAFFRAVFASALARPQPDRETGAPDPRTVPQRHYDAVMTVFRRGMNAAEGMPTGEKATVLLLMSVDQLVGSSEAPVETVAGHDVSAGDARLMACDAGLIPVVLGTKSQPLDVGRTARLATPAQLTALRVRDRGCTFPGCTMPPMWCDAHHLRHWARDRGPTDLANLTLLCQRHHTYVHREDVSWRFVDDDPDPPVRGAGEIPPPRPHIRWVT